MKPLSPLFKTGDVVMVHGHMFWPTKLDDKLGIVIKVNEDTETCYVMVGDVKMIAHFSRMYHVQDPE